MQRPGTVNRCRAWQTIHFVQGDGVLFMVIAPVHVILNGAQRREESAMKQRITESLARMADPSRRSG